MHRFNSDVYTASKSKYKIKVKTILVFDNIFKLSTTGISQNINPYSLRFSKCYDSLHLCS
jgi:hypothetical protein